MSSRVGSPVPQNLRTRQANTMRTGGPAVNPAGLECCDACGAAIPGERSCPGRWLPLVRPRGGAARGPESGSVRNRPDGSVEAIVEGEAESIERFEMAIRRGPSRSRVAEVEVDSISAERPSGLHNRMKDAVTDMHTAAPDQLKQKIRSVPDFPKPGINFYDITTLLQDPEGFRDTIAAMTAPSWVRASRTSWASRVVASSWARR